MFKRASVLLLLLVPAVAVAQLNFTKEERETQQKQRKIMRDISAEYLQIARQVEDAKAERDSEKVKELTLQLDKMRADMQTRLDNMREVHPMLISHLLEVSAKIDECEEHVLNLISDPAFFEVERPYVIDPDRREFEEYVNQVNMKASMLKAIASFGRMRFEVESAAQRMKPLANLQESHFIYGAVLDDMRHPDGTRNLMRVFDLSSAGIEQPSPGVIKAMGVEETEGTPYDELKNFVCEETRAFAAGMSDNCKIAYGGISGELMYWNPMDTNAHVRAARPPTFETIVYLVQSSIKRFDDVMLNQTEKDECITIYTNFLNDLFAKVAAKYKGMVVRPEGSVSALRTRDEPQAVAVVVAGIVEGLDSGVTLISKQAQQVRQNRWESQERKIRKAQLESKKQRDALKATSQPVK